MSDTTGTSYYVIGADGQRYGPVDFLTLQGWAAQGRVKPSTQVIAEPGGHQTIAQTIPGLFDGYTQPGKKSKSWILILAALGIFGVCGCGMLGAILFPVFAAARQAAKQTVAMSHLKQLSLGVIMYSSDNNDAFPTRMESATALKPYIDQYVRGEDTKGRPADPFVSTNAAGGEILGDKRLSGKSMIDLVDPDNSIMLYDSLPWNGNRGIFSYTNGAAKKAPYSEIERLLKEKPFGK